MGAIFCVGVGPGDPELMTIRAARLVREAKHVAYFQKKGRMGQARRIVEGLISPAATEHPMDYPVTIEIPHGDPAYGRLLGEFYDLWAEKLAALAEDEDVVVLAEGDPLFYGSFIHLLIRLKARRRIEITPGVTGISACWTALGDPFVWGDEALTVMAGTAPEAELARRMASAEALAVMKVGRNLPKIRRALATAGRLDEAWLVERAAMPGERLRPLREVEPDLDCPYFSVVLAQGRGKRFPVEAAP